MNETCVAATLARLQAVDWYGSSDLEHPRTRARLMAEYLRRAALWAQALNATDEWPFFDVTAHLSPAIHTPGKEARELEVLIRNHVGWPSVDRIARAILRWAAAKDAEVPLPPGLEDPYEPLLLMFDRGGAWTTEAGFIDTGLSSVRRQTWRHHLSTTPVTELDPVTLDGWDQPAR